MFPSAPASPREESKAGHHKNNSMNPLTFSANNIQGIYGLNHQPKPEPFARQLSYSLDKNVLVENIM